MAAATLQVPCLLQASVSGRRAACCQRTVARLQRPVACSAASNEAFCATSRRTAALLFSALPALFLAPPARALIPDDDDEELVERAKANRKARLASEREAEKEFKKSGGYSEGEVVAVQRAVNKLAKSGEALSAGDLPTVAATVADVWVSDLEKATQGLSSSDSAKSAAGAILQGIGALEDSAKKGSLEDAKRNFVTAVSALQTWADDAGIAASLKGL